MKTETTPVHLQNTEEIASRLTEGSRIFFIGCGGVSMSALAVIAKEKGFDTCGSDRARSRTTDMLLSSGIPVSIGHAPEHVRGCDAVVYNAAIGEDNPEYAEAVRLGIPLIYRADFLAYLMRGYKHGIGVAGMHGKSTTSAMLSHLFLYAKRDPAILIGAELPELGRDFRNGHGDDFIFEACEYKDSFLSFRPSVAVVLNEEMDHPDYFKSMDQIHDSFHKYLEIPGTDGFAVLNCDDEDVMISAEHIHPHRVTFGMENKEADFRAADVVFEGGCARFTILKGGRPFCQVRLSVPGTHNVMNALASAAAAAVCGLDAETIAGGLSTFTGAGRRMEYKGILKDCSVQVPVYDDFGHHPSEITTTLEGARRMGCTRLRCVYQPHTYSRTAELFEDFVTAFDACDEVTFVDIYAAREANTYGISSEELARRIPHGRYQPDLSALLAYLQKTSAEGDLLVIMGAGDISRFSAEIGIPAKTP